MSEPVQVITTTPSREDAEKIANALVDARLAACVQISGPITSTFHWNDAIETAEEWVCTAKTMLDACHDVEALMTEHHPYDVPEILAVPVVAVSEPYMKWLTDQIDLPK